MGLGAAAAMGLAGCSGSDATGTPTAGTTTGTPTGGDGSDAVDPRFGYVGTAGTEPPVEADHTVDLNIRPRDPVPVPEFYFEPTGLSVDPGDTVRFNMATPHHNVNAYHPEFGYAQRVPADAPAYSSPILTGGDYWLYTFETEGVHNIMCAPHEVFGMVGTVVVGSASGPGANPVGEAPKPTPQSRPPEFTAGTVLSDPAMDPDNIVEQGSVSWNDIADENKRLLLEPVEA
ncbi:cupredoxin domain-containing protein [Haloarcula onubensis]|nr:plastocyanin/azurin family copper-binding protein [Halomicroarcula sp. S3CR25-11]